VVFVSFSISALLAERGRWLYLGGTLMSMLNIMILFSLANLFLRSTLIYQAHLYLGLFVVCGFVIYDTQLIIEKHHMGSRDFIMHSLDLFIDFVGVFRHLLVILTQKVIFNLAIQKVIKYKKISFFILYNYFILFCTKEPFKKYSDMHFYQIYILLLMKFLKNGILFL